MALRELEVVTWLLGRVPWADIAPDQIGRLGLALPWQDRRLSTRARYFWSPTPPTCRRIQPLGALSIVASRRAAPPSPPSPQHHCRPPTRDVQWGPAQRRHHLRNHRPAWRRPGRTRACS